MYINRNSGINIHVSNDRNWDMNSDRSININK